MPTLAATDFTIKPRILIADDSRIVRATLIKQIEGLFDFREALDGEQAWEALLLDPRIRVVITDLSMPKLDGYGLLDRIRASRIGRIRDIPVIVVSGSDEIEERERAKRAGATDLITKGIGTAQLLSRLDVLANLVSSQHDYERSLEGLVRHGRADGGALPDPTETWRDYADALMAHALKSSRNCVVLNIGVGLCLAGSKVSVVAPPESVLAAIGQLLRRNVRESDCVARCGDVEFAVVTGSINTSAARGFAERVCRAITAAHLVRDDNVFFVASCGLASLVDDRAEVHDFSMERLHEVARRRARLGLGCGMSGVIGPAEEEGWSNSNATPCAERGENPDSPDLPTLLQWLKEGRQSDVQPHLARLSNELQPLIDLLLRQDKG